MSTTDLVDQVFQGQRGRYRVVRGGQSGAYAEVLRVQELSTGIERILKLNQREQAQEFQILSQVGQVLKAAGIPNRTVTAVDLLTTEVNQRVGHIEEIAVGQPVDTQARTEQQSLHIAVAFAQVLAACARNNIAYQDVKLNHIFWDRESGNVHIIDWNVARLNAAPADLRDDLLKFCDLLSALMGSPPVHPLEWSLATMKTDRGASLSFASWRLLTQLSVGWGGPLLDSLRDVVRAPGLMEARGRDPRQLVLNAWDQLVKSLQAVEALWLTHTSGVPGEPLVQGGSKTDLLLAEMDRASVRLIDVLPCEEWNNYLKRAAEHSTTARTQILVALSYISTQARLQYEPLLCSTRFLQPQDSSAALALAAYQLWERTGKRQDQQWKELFTTLAEGDLRAARDCIRRYGSDIEQGIQQTFASIETALDMRGLSQFWADVFTRFRSEVVLWGEVAEAEQHTDLPRRIETLETTLRTLAPSHPRVHLLIANANAQIARAERIAQADKQVREAIENSNIQAARLALQQLSELATQTLDAERLIQQYRPRVEQLEKELGTLARVRESLASWDQLMLDQTLVDLMTMPQTAQVQLVCDELRRRINSVVSLRTALSDISAEIERSTSRLMSDLRSIKDSADALVSAAEHLKSLVADTTYRAAPGIADLQQAWQHAATRLVQTVETFPAQPPTTTHQRDLDAQRTQLDQAREAIDALQRIKQVGRNELQLNQMLWASIEKHADRIEVQRLDVNQRYRRLFEQMQEQAQISASLPQREEFVRRLPPSLVQVWHDHLIGTVSRAIDDGNLDAARTQLNMMRALVPEIQRRLHGTSSLPLDSDLVKLERELEVKVALRSWDSSAVATGLDALRRLPSDSMRDRLLQELECRLEKLDEMPKKIEQLVATSARSSARDVASPPALQQRIDELRRVYSGIQDLQRDRHYQGAPQIRDAWRQWRSAVERIVAAINISMADQQLRSDELDSQIEHLGAMQAALLDLKHLTDLLPEIEDGQTQHALSDTLRDQIVSNEQQIRKQLELAQNERRELRSQFERRLRQPEVYPTLADELATLPFSLRRELELKLRQVWQQHLLEQLYSAIGQEQPARVREIPIPNLIRDPDFNEKLKQLYADADAKQLEIEANQLLNHQSDAVWVSEANRFAQRLPEGERRRELESRIVQIEGERTNTTLGVLQRTQRRHSWMLGAGIALANALLLTALILVLFGAPALAQGLATSSGDSSAPQGTATQTSTTTSVTQNQRSTPAPGPIQPRASSLQGTGTGRAQPTLTAAPTTTPSPADESQLAASSTTSPVVRAVKSGSKLFADQAGQDVLLEYVFQGNDISNQPVAVTVRVIGTQVGDFVQIQADFAVYEAGLDLAQDGATVLSIKKDARLRSPTQRAIEAGPETEIYARLGTTAKVLPVGNGLNVQGRQEDPLRGPWYPIQITGWIRSDALQ